MRDMNIGFRLLGLLGWFASTVLVASCVLCQSAVAEEEKNAAGEASAAEEAPKAATKKPAPKHKHVGADPRGGVDLTVCSQNLKLFGTLQTVRAKNSSYTKAEHSAKIADLVSRFTKVDCDVIAVQEVMGATEPDAKAAIEELAQRLKQVTNRVYATRVAPPAEGGMTMGFLIAQDRATVLSAVAYEKVELPKIAEKQRPRLFLRTPMELQISAHAKGGQEVKAISIVNFHLKSKRGGAADPTGLEWETYRMEMAEALRRIIDSRHKQSFASGESLLMVLGDRNGNYDVASARILEGSLVLSNFKKDGGCRLSKRGLPLCKPEISLPQRLFSVFARNERVQSLPGTFAYQGEYSWLDDILMPAESLPYAWSSAFSEGRYNSGVVYNPKAASDHAMVYVKLNW
jgi:endonuclease/exonuclease/phosphatase family metal-dependent hydrolase